MKTLQNNFTTPEQSKRLLELGVPADSADCFCHEGGKWVGIFRFGDKISDFPARFGRTPCWSVGRLIEVYLLCAEEPTNFVTNVIFFKGNNMSNIEVLIDSIKTTSMDFSKLEE